LRDRDSLSRSHSWKLIMLSSRYTPYEPRPTTAVAAETPQKKGLNNKF